MTSIKEKGKSPYVRYNKRPYDYSHLFDGLESERYRRPFDKWPASLSPRPKFLPNQIEPL